MKGHGHAEDKYYDVRVKKSSDPDSRVFYIRTHQHSLISHHLQIKEEDQTLARYEAAKRRRLNRAVEANNQEDDESLA